MASMDNAIYGFVYGDHVYLFIQDDNGSPSKLGRRITDDLSTLTDVDIKKLKTYLQLFSHQRRYDGTEQFEGNLMQLVSNMNKYKMLKSATTNLPYHWMYIINFNNDIFKGTDLNEGRVKKYPLNSIPKNWYEEVEQSQISLSYESPQANPPEARKKPIKASTLKRIRELISSRLLYIDGMIFEPIEVMIGLRAMLKLTATTIRGSDEHGIENCIEVDIIIKGKGEFNVTIDGKDFVSTVYIL